MPRPFGQNQSAWQRGPFASQGDDGRLDCQLWVEAARQPHTPSPAAYAHRIASAGALSGRISGQHVASIWLTGQTLNFLLSALHHENHAKHNGPHGPHVVNKDDFLFGFARQFASTRPQHLPFLLPGGRREEWHTCSPLGLDGRFGQKQHRKEATQGSRSSELVIGLSTHGVNIK